MEKRIVDLAGRDLGQIESVVDLTGDPGLIALCECQTLGDIRRLWVERKVDNVDLQVYLAMHLISEQQRLVDVLGVFVQKLDMLLSRKPYLSG